MRALILIAMPTLLATLGVWSPAARAEVVDRIEVVVEDELVMASDRVVDGILQDLDDSPSPFWSTAPADPTRRLADAALIRHLAGDIGIYQPAKATVDRRLEALVLGAFENRRAWKAFLAQWGLDEASVRSLLKRRVLVERFLARNLVGAETPELWWEAYERLMAPERSRARIRYVALETQ